jgi:hypothetical protein
VLKRWPFLLVVLVLLFGVRPRLAGPYYVAVGGTGINCTQYQTVGTASPTIAAALACLASGETVLIRTGTYNERIENAMPSGGGDSTRTRVAAYPGAAPFEVVTLAPTSGNEVVKFDGNTSYLEFDGINLDASSIAGTIYLRQVSGVGPHHMRFKNGNYHGGFGAAAISLEANTSDHVGAHEFQHVVVHDCGDEAQLDHCFYTGQRDWVLEDSEIYNFGGAGVQLYHGGGVPTADHVVIRRNYIHDSLNFAGGHWGILVSEAHTNPEIYNNLILNVSQNAGPADCINTYSVISGLKLYNNTVINCARYGILIDTDSTGADVRNNIAYLNGTNYLNNGTATTASSNLTDGTNPNFVGGGDYHLSATSTASIDTGECLGTVPTDKDGATRPQGTGCDRGAYEYLVAGTLPGVPAALSPTNGASVALGPLALSFTSSAATAYDFYLSPYIGVGASAYSDSFDGVDTTDLGIFWTPYTLGGFTNLQRVGSRVRNTSTTLESAERFDGGSLANDQWVRIRLDTFGTGFVSAAVLLRVQTSTQFSGYFIGAVKGYAGQPTWRTWAYRYTNGAFVFLGSETATPWNTGDFLEAHAVGNTLTIYRNGNDALALALSVTDPLAAYPSGGVGLYAASSTIGQVEINNFEAGNIGPVFQGTFTAASFAVLTQVPGQTNYWKPAGRNAQGVTEGAISSFTFSGTAAVPVGVRLRCVHGTPSCP